MTNHITTKWLGEMAFESNNPSGETIKIDAGPESGGSGEGLRPKALMLSSLAGCSGLDVASLIKKMKLDVKEFKIETIANLTDEHPKYYDSVVIEYHFTGSDLNEEKLKKSGRPISGKILWCNGNVQEVCKIGHQNFISQ
jgi:putative redox protein